MRKTLATSAAIAASALLLTAGVVLAQSTTPGMGNNSSTYNSSNSNMSGNTGVGTTNNGSSMNGSAGSSNNDTNSNDFKPGVGGGPGTMPNSAPSTGLGGSQ